MKLTVEITRCAQCRYVDHSGAFTPGGAKRICGHNDASRLAPGKEKKDYWHWKYRVVKEDRVPAWCPLKHGRSY